MNNNSGESKSIWMETEIPNQTPLQKNLKADVCIIGAGIAGLTCAYMLAKQGKSVIVLEKGPIAGGQTARTTAHLSWALDEHFFSLRKLFGDEGAKLAAESHQAAINSIAAIVKEEKIDCDFEWIDGYLFQSPDDSEDTLNKEWKAVQQLDLDVKKVKKGPYPFFDTGPCLQFPRQAQFHVLKYLAKLTKVLLKHDVQIFTDTTVLDIKNDKHCVIETETKYHVTAHSTIVATCTPINDRYSMHTKQSAYRTYAIAATVPKDSVPNVLAWDTQDPYHYIRLQPKDADWDWLIVGGEDHKTGQETNLEDRYDRLEKWSRTRFPMIDSIDARWSGQVFEPIDGLAFIGPNPLDKNVYICTGDSGHGMTHGTIAGLLLTDLILEKEHPWAKLYHPSRKTLSAMDEFLKENLNVAVQYKEWVTAGDVKDAEELAPGQGAVIRKGLKKLAVYRDEEGKIHSCSAVCTHLGGIVQWNAGEKSWDCPCHGARFDIDGKVMNGPAVKDLSPE